MESLEWLLELKVLCEEYVNLANKAEAAQRESTNDEPNEELEYLCDKLRDLALDIRDSI